MAITVVQQSVGSSGASNVTTLTRSFGVSTTAGSLLVGLVGVLGNGGTFTEPTNWTVVFDKQLPGAQTEHMSYRENAPAAAAAPQWTWVTTGRAHDQVFELAGAATSGSLDTFTVVQNTTTTTPTAGTVTSAGPGIAIAALFVATAILTTHTSDGDHTYYVTGTTNNATMSADKVVAAGSVTVTFTMNSSNVTQGGTAIFKEAAGAPSTFVLAPRERISNSYPTYGMYNPPTRSSRAWLPLSVPAPPVTWCGPQDTFPGTSYQAWWTSVGSDCSVSGNRHRTLITTGTTGHGNISTATSYTLAGAKAHCEVAVDTDPGGYFYFGISGASEEVAVDLFTGVLRFFGTGLAAFTMPYDPVAHRWWRVWETGGLLYFDTSPDGSTWATQAVRPHALTLTSMAIIFSASETGTPIGAFAYADNLNTPPGTQVSATTVPGVASLATPTVSSTISLTAVPGVASLGAPTVSPTITAVKIPGVATVPTPTVNVTNTLVTVPGVATLGSPTLVINPTPPTVAGVATLGSPALSATITAVKIPGVATIPTPVINPTIALTAVPGVASLAAPTINVTNALVTVPGVATLGAPTVSPTLVPVTVAGVASIPTPTVLTGTVVVAAVVPGVATLGAPAISITTLAVTVPGVATVPTPVVNPIISLTAVPGVASLGAPTVSVTITAVKIPGVATLGALVITATCTIVAITVPGVATLGSPTVSALIVLSTVPGVASVPIPSIQTGASTTIVAITVPGVASLAAPAISSLNVLSTVAGVATIGSPKLLATLTLVTVPGVATLPGPSVSVTNTLVKVSGVATLGSPVITITVVLVTVPGMAAVYQPALSATIALVKVAGVASVPSPTITTAALSLAITVPGSTSLGAPRISSLITLVTVAAIASLDVPTIVLVGANVPCFVVVIDLASIIVRGSTSPTPTVTVADSARDAEATDYSLDTDIVDGALPITMAVDY